MTYAATIYGVFSGMVASAVPSLAQQRETVALHHEPDVQQREHPERQEQRDEHLAGERRGAGLQDDRLRVQRPEHDHAEVHERHETRAADPDDRRVACPQPGVGHRPAQQQIPDVHEEEEQREREACVPRPPRPPDRLPPDRAGRQHDAAEHEAGLGGRLSEAIETGVLEEQVKDAPEADQDHRRFGPERGRDVQVKDLLRHALRALDRREGQRPHVHAREQQQANRRDPASRLQQLHSLTVAGKRRNARATNTRSKAASNLSQPVASLKGRPASRAAVASTAQMRGGSMNGRSRTGNSSSAKRVRAVIALNSVPTATNPTVASAITTSNGPSTGRIATLKNSANRGRPTPSTTATKIRFATSLPR